MVIAGLVMVALAALIHLYIFVLESLTWTSDRTRAVFGTTAEQAVQTRQLAFNQGFYNLFLAVEVIAGIVAVAFGAPIVGITLIAVGALSMVLAGVVLVASDRRKARAALIQMLPPLIGVIVGGIGLL